MRSVALPLNHVDGEQSAREWPTYAGGATVLVNVRRWFILHNSLFPASAPRSEGQNSAWHVFTLLRSPQAVNDRKPEFGSSHFAIPTLQTPFNELQRWSGLSPGLMRGAYGSMSLVVKRVQLESNDYIPRHTPHTTFNDFIFQVRAEVGRQHVQWRGQRSAFRR